MSRFLVDLKGPNILDWISIYYT